MGGGDRGFPFSGAALMAEMQHDTALCTLLGIMRC